MKASLMILALLLTLPGCATGVTMTKDEEAACKVQGCSAWTMQELEGLARKFYELGYHAGVKSI